MDLKSEFNLYATKGKGINSLTLERYKKYNNLRSAYINPTIIEERELNVAQMDVFSRLMMERIIFLGTAIDDDVANIIQAQLLFLESTNKDRDIQIYLNTPGGYVQAGLGIYDTMQYIKCDVSTICVGLAASMGAFLLAGGKKGKRYALPNSEIMIHQPSGGTKGQATEIQIAAENILKTKERLNRILAANTGQPYEKVCEDTERDHFMTAEEALNYGLVDGIITSRADQEKEEH
jgi:ATP-dependent Clp protease protease subunit